MLPESAEVVLFAALVLAFAILFAPTRAPRRSLVLRGGAGLAGTIAIAAVPTFELALLVLLGLGVLNASAAGRRSFAIRLRAPVLAVAVIALALVLARATGPEVLGRFAAIAAGPHGDGTTRQPGRRRGAGRVGAVRRVRRPRAAPARRDPAVLAAGARACGGDAAVAAGVAAAWSQPWSPAGPPGAWRG